MASDNRLEVLQELQEVDKGPVPQEDYSTG
jgi:hypothetical protein